MGSLLVICSQAQCPAEGHGGTHTAAQGPDLLLFVFSSFYPPRYLAGELGTMQSSLLAQVSCNEFLTAPPRLSSTSAHKGDLAPPHLHNAAREGPVGPKKHNLLLCPSTHLKLPFYLGRKHAHTLSAELLVNPRRWRGPASSLSTVPICSTSTGTLGTTTNSSNGPWSKVLLQALHNWTALPG